MQQNTTAVASSMAAIIRASRTIAGHIGDKINAHSADAFAVSIANRIDTLAGATGIDIKDVMAMANVLSDEQLSILARDVASATRATSAPQTVQQETPVYGNSLSTDAAVVAFADATNEDLLHITATREALMMMKSMVSTPEAALFVQELISMHIGWLMSRLDISAKQLEDATRDMRAASEAAAANPQPVAIVVSFGLKRSA